jgi:hypothetical protein
MGPATSAITQKYPRVLPQILIRVENLGCPIALLHTFFNEVLNHEADELAAHELNDT